MSDLSFSEVIKVIWVWLKEVPLWYWIAFIVFYLIRVYINRNVWGGKYLWIPPFLKREPKEDKTKEMLSEYRSRDDKSQDYKK